MNKQELIDLGKQTGLDYVCTELKGKKKVYLYSDRPNPKEYKFREFAFFLGDLTIENMLFCKEHGFSR